MSSRIHNYSEIRFAGTRYKAIGDRNAIVRNLKKTLVVKIHDKERYIKRRIYFPARHD
jgi:hypothetical protein